MIDYDKPVSVKLAEFLRDNGYHQYAERQLYTKSPDEKIYTSYTLEHCAMIELNNRELLYLPTYNEVFRWINKNDPGWVLCVLYDARVKGFYFVVQNRVTGYDYRQPATPSENDEAKMYEWGVCHIVNRLSDDDSE